MDNNSSRAIFRAVQMSKSEKHWKTVTRSQYPWEQEALDFIYGQFPAQDHYRAWANFEFIADDGSINEVDLLVGSLQNAAIVISRLFRGEKRLVFCDSRSRVEEIGNELRSLGVSVFLSHSSLSVDERRTSEQAFAQSQDCVIVATSTLELGIDVGDLDRVIQIDAPWSVASFLQRLGRTGRRAGTFRNCLFLATSENALLRAGSLLELWASGYVESVTPPRSPTSSVRSATDGAIASRGRHWHPGLATLDRSVALL